MLARMWSNKDLHSLLVGVQSVPAAKEDSVMLSYKTKDSHVQSNNHPVLWYLSKELNTSTQKATRDVFGSRQLYSQLPKLQSNQDIL